MEYLWGSQKKGGAPISKQVRQAAHHMFAAWAEGLHEAAGALEERLIKENPNLSQGEIRALVGSLVTSGTSGQVKNAYLAELIKNLGLEPSQLEASNLDSSGLEEEKEKMETARGLGGESVSQVPPEGVVPDLPAIKPLPGLPPDADTGLQTLNASQYEALESISGGAKTKK